ncbi:ABC transporter permease subunit [Bacillus spongiae]|uniref:ABC transporter permease subunit n=1 Tax=Bacillus spongiae TaxID=2683610 RepID=A0ABU8HBT5_9BACI
MFKRLVKNPSFLIGFTITFSLLLLSILYSVVYEDDIPKVSLMFSEEGEVIAPPYSPLEYPPLGTDNVNRSIFLLIIIGAKYTIGFGLIITVLRVFPAVLFGLILHFYFKRFRRMIQPILDAFNYFPPSLLVFLLLEGIFFVGPMMEQNAISYGVTEKVIISLIILITISIPSLSLLFSNEYYKIMNNEFIDSAKVLGASKRHYIMKHIKPFIIPQIILVSIREFMTVLLLIAHLGVLKSFIGGSKRVEDVFENNVYVPNLNEWSGLLGNWWEFLWTTYPWIPFIPILFITITILAAKLMLIGVTKAIEDFQHEKAKETSQSLQAQTKRKIEGHEDSNLMERISL